MWYSLFLILAYFLSVSSIFKTSSPPPPSPPPHNNCFTAILTVAMVFLIRRFSEHKNFSLPNLICLPLKICLVCNILNFMIHIFGIVYSILNTTYVFLYIFFKLPAGDGKNSFFTFSNGKFGSDVFIDTEHHMVHELSSTMTHPHVSRVKHCQECYEFEKFTDLQFFINTCHLVYFHISKR